MKNVVRFDAGVCTGKSLAFSYLSRWKCDGYDDEGNRNPLTLEFFVMESMKSVAGKRLGCRDRSDENNEVSTAF